MAKKEARSLRTARVCRSSPNLPPAGSLKNSAVLRFLKTTYAPAASIWRKTRAVVMPSCPAAHVKRRRLRRAVSAVCSAGRPRSEGCHVTSPSPCGTSAVWCPGPAVWTDHRTATESLHQICRHHRVMHKTQRISAKLPVALRVVLTALVPVWRDTS